MALFKNLNFDQKEGEIKQKQTEVEHGGGREGTRRRTKKAKQILIFLEQVNFCKVRNIFYIYTIHSIFSGFFQKSDYYDTQLRPLYYFCILLKCCYRPKNITFKHRLHSRGTFKFIHRSRNSIFLLLKSCHHSLVCI